MSGNSFEMLFLNQSKQDVHPSDPREIMDAIFWILRTGAPWRDLPEEFGPWQSAWRLFDKWNGDGTLVRVLQKLQAAFIELGEIDNELWCIDGTSVRAARCAAAEEKRVVTEPSDHL